MRVLFYYRGFESIGIEYLSAVLKQAGHEVDLVFDPGFDDNAYMRMPLLKKLNRSDRMIRKAKAFDPELICFSCLTNLYPYVSSMATVLKRELRKPVIVGGAHATSLPEFVLSHPDVDMVCIGEGEEALLELVTRMDRGDPAHDTKNIWFKNNGDIIKNPLRPMLGSLDELPLPDKDLFYREGAFNRSVMVITSRGCVFNCAYCTHEFQRRLYRETGGYRVRRRSVENVMEELHRYKGHYHANKFLFEDDDFASDEKWVEDFCSRYGREIGIPFYCLTNPRQITETKLRLLKTAGCFLLFMGIDSGSEEVRRKRLNRKFTDAELIHTAERIKKAGISLYVTAMFAIPGEEPEDMKKTVSLITSIRPDTVSTYTFYPYPKTALYAYATEIGLIDEEVRQAVYQGKSSLHGMSVLNHPHKKLAFLYANMLPLLNRLPRFLQPFFLRVFMFERIYRISPVVYYLFVPFTHSTFGLLRIKDMIHMIVRSVLPERRRQEQRT